MSNVIAIDLIDPELRPASLVRAAMNEDAIDDYSEQMDDMPSVKVFVDEDGHHWLGDGAHTCTAAKRRGMAQIKADVVRGSYFEALGFACKANEKNGVRPTRADGRKRLAEVLDRPETAEWSDRDVAKFCCISQPTVSKVRKARKESDCNLPDKFITSGKSRVNGRVVDDPPEIAKKRREGKIPPNTIVEIDDEDNPTTLEAVKEDHDERCAIQNEISDADWLTTLPLSGVLKGTQLATFREDALAWRHLESARKSFHHHASREFSKVKRKGHYIWRVKFFLGVDAPEKWKLCPQPFDGGCGGSGYIELGDKHLECGQCRGVGYRIVKD